MLGQICSAQREAGQIVLTRAEIYWTQLFGDEEKFVREDRTTWFTIQALARAGWTVHAPAAALPDPGSAPGNVVAEQAARRPLSQQVIVVAGSIQCKRDRDERSDPFEYEAERIARLASDDSPAARHLVRCITPLPRDHSLESLGVFISGSTRLARPLRGRMENRFGADFSGVHIQDGPGAASLCRGYKARAFTRGSDIYFNTGEYDPHSQRGRHLLAHELTHVVQQRAAGPIVQRQARSGP